MGKAIGDIRLNPAGCGVPFTGFMLGAGGK